MSNTRQLNILRNYYDMLFPAELKENEYVRLVVVKPPTPENPEPIPKALFVKDFQEYADMVRKYKYTHHVYNSLCTVKEIDGEPGGTVAYQRQRRVLYIDFDLKDFPELKNPDAYYFSQLIKEQFPNIFIHAYYASGGGFHFYIAVKPTCDWRELVKVNGDIIRLVGADQDANKSTQIARVPTTYNHKYVDADGKHPYVKEVVNSYQRHPMNGHKGYYELTYIKSLVTMAERGNRVPQEQPLQEFAYTAGEGLLEVKQYPCLCNKIAWEQGVEEHERNTFMGRLIFQMLKEGKSESYIHAEIQRWNMKCRPPKGREEVTREVNGWLKGKEVYNIGGCWFNMEDNSRARVIVEKYCDKSHCLETRYNNVIPIAPNTGVKMNKKVLTKNHLRWDSENSMSGYEYLILTVLDKHIPANSRKPYTIGELKKRLMYKSHGKWGLCMDLATFKKTINELVEHKCITVATPTEKQCGKKKPTYDDGIIKLTRRLKDINNTGFIEFYYSSALAFICKQITQREYKVFLCLLQQMEEHRACTLTELSYILGIGKGDVSKALDNLDKAQCIEISRMKPGQNYNIYKKKSTNDYNDITYSDDTDLNKIITDNGSVKDKDMESVIIKLLA